MLLQGFKPTGINPSIVMPLNCLKKGISGCSKALDHRQGSITFITVFIPSRPQAEQRRAVAVQPPVSYALEKSSKDCEVSTPGSLVCLKGSFNKDVCAMSHLSS